MANLLMQTVRETESEGYRPDDIIFIGTMEGLECTWEQFTLTANKDYDDGYGWAEVNRNLIIAFKDGAIMKRGEYDGAEWWDMHLPFKRPEVTGPLDDPFDDGYDAWD